MGYQTYDLKAFFCLYCVVNDTWTGWREFGGGQPEHVICRCEVLFNTNDSWRVEKLLIAGCISPEAAWGAKPEERTGVEENFFFFLLGRHMIYIYLSGE